MKVVADSVENGVPSAISGGAPHALLEEERTLLLVLIDDAQDERLSTKRRGQLLETPERLPSSTACLVVDVGVVLEQGAIVDGLERLKR